VTRAPRIRAEICAPGKQRFFSGYGRSMPRPPREFEPGLPYHVTIRGNDGRRIFTSSGDATFFLSLAECAFRRHEITCAAYCLMSTHYHLLVVDGCERLPAAMQVLNGSYARAWNHRYGREHHLFGRRYASIPVESDRHLLAGNRYIARNPVEAGICRRPEHYRWSSYRALVGRARAPSFVDPHAVLDLFHPDRAAAMRLLREFVESPL
jgi:REP-associated tyrosine transposase